MTEDIELQSYITGKLNNEDIEEYHEIHEGIGDDGDTNFVSHKLPPAINPYDFFTQLQPKSLSKKTERKKKHKKSQNKNTTIMDIISTELAQISMPLKENVIELVSDQAEDVCTYLERLTSGRGDRRIMQRRMPMDSQYGYNRRSSKYIKLRPVFPRVLENASPVPPKSNIPVEYMDPVSFEDMIQEYETTDKQPTKFLDIEIKNIKFKHHHTFSLENVLVLKLTEYLSEHNTLEKKIHNLSKEVSISRDTKINLKKELLKASPNKSDNMRFDETLRKYVDNFLQLKEKYINAIKTQIEVIHKIISLWSDIEAVREKTKLVQSPYNLFIKRDAKSKKEYENEWNQAYEVEFTDALDKIEYNFVTEYMEYRELKHNQNDANSKKKPIKPKMRVEEDEIKESVHNILKNVVKKEIMTFDLKIDEDKLAYMKRNNYQFDIYVDDTFVCESEMYTSNDAMLNTSLTECFSVEILPHNSILALVLKENDQNVSQIELSLPHISKSKGKFAKLLFQYKNNVEPTVHHAGSGHTIKEIASVNKVRLKSGSIFKDKLVTACEVKIKIDWSENLEQNNEEAMKDSVDIGNEIKRLIHGIEKPNFETLSEIIGKIYSRDINNDESMINTLKQVCKREKKVQDKFNLDENSSDSVRLKLLHLRNSGGFTDVENKRIPIHGSQISTEHLNCLQKTKEKDFDIEYLKEKEVNMDPIELQRFVAAKYIQKLNSKMIKNLNEHLMVKTQKDVVRELKDFSFRCFFPENNTDNATHLPNSTKQKMLSEAMTKEQDIYITVVRAFNLLDRSSPLFDDGENFQEMEIAGYKVRPLRPFVRASYHGTSVQTVTAIGCHPSWNHTVKICTRLDPLSSLHINIYDECKVNIAEGSDEQSTSTVHYRHFNKWLGTAQLPLFTVLSMGSLRGTFKVTSPPLLFGYEANQNKESSSLIPEITQLMKRDTSYITLHVTTTLSHLGGIQAYNQPLPSSVDDDYIIKHLNTFVTEYTNDFPERNISLTFIDSGGRNKCVTQFLQPIPLPNRDYFPKNPKSCGSAMSKSSGISRSSSSKSSGRKREIDLEANDEKESEYSHTSVRSTDSLVKLINGSLRFVALIPSYEVTETHAVTLMGLELLKVLYGTPLDHSILLASYFLYLGIKSFIAIGLGLPRGRSSYVLIQYDLATRRFLTTDQVVRSRGILEKREGVVWHVCDAASGERHELRDVGCPMKTVDYVFDNENIWVNVQMSQDCENLSFDFTKSSDWQPVFDKSIFIMKQSIVNDIQLYSSPSEVESLRAALEARIKGKVQKWRALKKTVWNRYCSGLLRDALMYWEYWSFNSNEPKPVFSQKLKQLTVTYKIFGFPLNMSFVNTKSVITAIKSTGLLVNDEPTVEFGLAVEVYGYPNNVLSIWVFLVSIAKI